MRGANVNMNGAKRESFEELLQRAVEEGNAGALSFYRQGCLLSRIFRETKWSIRYGSSKKLMTELGIALGVSSQSVWYRILVAEGATGEQVERHGFHQMRIYLQCSEKKKPLVWAALQKGRMTLSQVEVIAQTRRGNALFRMKGNGLEARIKFDDKKQLLRFQRAFVKHLEEGESSGCALTRVLESI
jgi:hypothetical protein